MKNIRNLLYIYLLLEMLFIIMFLILTILFRFNADNVYILLLINLITIFPLPLTNVILDYRITLNKNYNRNFNEIVSYYEYLLTIKNIINMLEKEDKNQLNKGIEKIANEKRKRILYQEIFTISPWININPQMSSLFDYINGIELQLNLVTKNYDSIKIELQKEIELFDKTMLSIHFYKTNKKWEKEIEKIKLKWSDLE